MNSVLAIAPILIVILLPGYSLLPDKYPKRLRLPFVIFVSVAVTSAIGLALLAGGQFNVGLLALIELPLLLIRARSKTWPGLEITHHLPIIVLFCLAAAFAIGTSGEPFDATGDAGVYTISALHLAESGEWSWPLDEVIPPGISEELVSYRPHLVNPWREVAPGFILRDRHVVPQFFPLFPLWGAIFCSWLGIYGVLAANLLGALMILFGFDALFHLLAGRVWRFAGLAAILFNPVFLVFLKYPSAEVFLSGILAGWLFWMVLFLRKPTAKEAVLPATLLALAILTKFFAWAVTGTIFIVLVLLPWRRAKATAVFLSLLVPAILIDAWLATPHLANHFGQLMILSGFKIIAIGCAGVFLLRLLWTRFAKWAPLGLAVLYLAVLVLLWFRSEASHVLDFAALSGPGVLWGGAAGLLWYVLRRRSIWLVFPAFVFVLLSLFLFLGSGDSPYYPFAARRYLPITIPLGALFLAYLVRSLSGFAHSVGRVPARVASAASGLVLALVLLPPFWTQRTAIMVRQGAGFTAALAELESVIPEDEVVLATGQAWRYSPHLLLRGAPVFCLDLNRAGVLANIEELLENRPGTLVLTNERREADVRGVVKEHRTGIEITTTPPLNAARPWGSTFGIFGVERSGRVEPDRLDIGTDDHLQVAGFFAPEQAGDRSFRWTGAHARIMISAGDEMRFVWSRGGNPHKPLPVSVFVRGTLVGIIDLEGGWQTSRWFPIPEGEEPPLVEIRSPTFKPAQHGPGNDRRNLGLRLDLIETR